MKLKTEIICKNYEQLNIVQHKVQVNEQHEEYYIIPLNKDYDLEYDDKVMKLTFTNQLLWLKYSNSKGEILLKEYDFHECVVIKSEYILDIYVKITDCHEYIRRNIYHTRNSPSFNKVLKGKYILALPIINEMIKVKEYGLGIKEYEVEMITNEILMKKVKDRGNKNGYINITNNMMLNKEGVFLPLKEGEEDLFVE